MTPAPIPSPRPPLQHQCVVGSSEYIGPADIASPTFPPTFHHSNNHCHMHMENGSVDVIQQSMVVQLNANVHNTDTNVHNTDCNTNIASSSIVTPQQQAPGDNLDHSVIGNSKSLHQQSSPSHGTITTPTGLVAVIDVSTLNGTVQTADHMISSQKYPGYFEHKINDTHL